MPQGRARARAVTTRRDWNRAAMPNALSALLVAFVLALAFAGPARADFKVCNDTDAEVGVSIGFRDAEDWVTEGWWLIPAQGCAPVVRGKLKARYFYLFAEEAKAGGQWRGPVFMCTSNKQFRIKGMKNCYARGHEQMGFFEVDTGQQTSWQVRLTEAERRRDETTPSSTN